MADVPKNTTTSIRLFPAFTHQSELDATKPISRSKIFISFFRPWFILTFYFYHSPLYIQHSDGNPISLAARSPANMNLVAGSVTWCSGLFSARVLWSCWSIILNRLLACRGTRLYLVRKSSPASHCDLHFFYPCKALVFRQGQDMK